jgi:hypothetical protein
VPNPRWNRCACEGAVPKTFRPIKAWLQGRASPELVYLETKWASLLPFAKVADLLKEVLPVGDSTNQQTICNHLHATAGRIEGELGDERQLNLFEGSEEEWNNCHCRTGLSHWGLMAVTCGRHTSKAGSR